MKLISVNEASGTLGIHIMTIYKLIKEGDLKAVRIGRRVLISESEIKLFIEKCATAVGNKEK